MTLKANANRQFTNNSSRGERYNPGRSTAAVPRLRRGSHLPGHFLADAIVIPYIGDVNLNLQTVSNGMGEGIRNDISSAGILKTAGIPFPDPAVVGGVSLAAAYDEDEEDDDEKDEYEDDELDEDDDEDLEDEDDEDFEDDLDDEDDDDSLDDEDEEDDEDEDDEEE